MALLYSGLDAAAAGEVVAELEAEGVAFEVRRRGDPGRRAPRATASAWQLAAKGLPAGGPAGYEILDSLTGFGTTSQMFDAAYWRAKEGELARTITGSPNVRAARVHLANPVAQPFARTPPGSASVTVTMARGTLERGQAEAIRYLVSSAVAGIAPEAVAVIDAAARRGAGRQGGPADRRRRQPNARAETHARQHPAPARGAGRAGQGDRRGQRRRRHGQPDDHRATDRSGEPGGDQLRDRGELGERAGQRAGRHGGEQPAGRRRRAATPATASARRTRAASGRTSRSPRPGASG